MHWDALLEEVLNKASKQQTLVYPLSPSAITRKEAKKYYLGMRYRGVYFTNREAEVMIQLLQGKTLCAAAAVLNLSPRTIEFYVKNMKTKLSCRTKSELIGKVFASDFIKNVDFIAYIVGE